jgi:hypothetical protein
VAKDIFERLAKGRPQQAKKPTKQRLKNTGLVARWKQKTEAEAFLKSVLADGPMPAAIIAELGTTRKFSKIQLWRAKRRIGAVASKKKGKFGGPWFWSLAQHAPKSADTTKPGYTRALRNLSRSLGYRLQPIGTATNKAGLKDGGESSKIS